MAEFRHILSDIAPWVGLVSLALIFLANALGVLNQSVAIRELEATGLRAPRARAAIGFGRILQLAAAPCLFFGSTRPFAALSLAAFLFGATMTAHAFWAAPASERDRQLANFLKNIAILGGLMLAAGWSG